MQKIMYTVYSSYVHRYHTLYFKTAITKLVSLTYSLPIPYCTFKTITVRELTWSVVSKQRKCVSVFLGITDHFLEELDFQEIQSSTWTRKINPPQKELIF